MIMLKLLKLIKPESLARSRKRVKANLKESAIQLIYTNIMRDGMFGYERESSVYGRT